MLLKFAIWQFLLLSGSCIYYLVYSSITIPLFLLTGILIFNQKKSVRTKVSLKNNLLKIVPLIIYVLLNNIILHRDVTTHLYLTFIFYALATCLIISSVSFKLFREKLLKYLNILCILSIFAEIYVLLGGAPNHVTSDNFDFILYLGFFNPMPGGHLRNASIYWEPGVFQIVLISILSFSTDMFFKKREQKKLILPIICLILSNSTTGYLAMAIIVFGLTFKTKIGKKHPILLPVVYGVSASIVYLIITSPIVQEKFAEDNVSYVIRYNDNLALYQMTVEKPIIGYGMDSQTYKTRSIQLDNLSASNGWLYLSATNGLPMLAYFIILIFIGVKKMKRRVSPIFIVLALLLTQAAEYVAFFPTIFLFIYKFKDDRNFNSNSNIQFVENNSPSAGKRVNPKL